MTKICPVCGKEIKDKKHPNKKYCNKICFGKAHQINIIGKKFGRLTVLKEVKTKYKDRYFLCKCECGNEKIIRGSHLTTNATISCGCYRDEKITKLNTTHHLSKSRIYSIYKDIIKRCTNQSHSTYKNYGGRGIIICEEWKNDFLCFYNWAINNGYKEDLTIDRINVNGNYEPDNCRWITKKQQSNNKRNSHYLTFKGQTSTIAEWGEKLNIRASKIRKRINQYHWTVERALTTP